MIKECIIVAEDIVFSTVVVGSATGCVTGDWTGVSTGLATGMFAGILAGGATGELLKIRVGSDESGKLADQKSLSVCFAVNSKSVSLGMGSTTRPSNRIVPVLLS